METITFTAPDISCHHCKTTIERELGSVPGVTSCSVDVPTQRITVVHDPLQVSREAMVAVLEEEGYPVAS